MFSFDAQYLMGYLPVVMLTLHAKFGVLPTKNIYIGPTPLSPTDVEQIMMLSQKGIRGVTAVSAATNVSRNA